MTRAGMALVAVVLAAATTAKAQELEPRAFANAPVGLNFLILGYGYSRGDVSLDTSAPIEDGKVTVHSAVLAYARSLDAWGRTAKLDLVLPYAWLSGSAKIAGKPVEREVSGLGDPDTPLVSLLRGAGAHVGGVRRLQAGSHPRRRRRGDGAAGPVRFRQARERRDQPLVVQARDRHLQDVRAGDPGARAERHLLHGQREFLRGPETSTRSALRRAGAPDLPHEVRSLDRSRRDLLRGRAHHHQWSGRRAAAGLARGRHPRDPDQPLQLDQARGEHRRLHARGRQLHDGRHRLAVPLGRGTLVEPISGGREMFANGHPVR